MCAAQGTRVCSLELPYIGWYAYGCSWQVDDVGSYLTCCQPLATLAVIEPDWPVDWSLITTWKPAVVSCRSTVSWSPEFMKRSVAGFGVSDVNGGAKAVSGSGAA